MAISAYDTQGRLKKNPLLGTSILSQPKREDQVKQFRGLHQEAATSGDTSRKAGLARLNKRYSTFAAPHMSRLSAISEKQKGLGAQLAAARSPAREAELSAQQKQYQDVTDKLKGLSGQELKDAHRGTTYDQGVEAALFYGDLRTRNQAIDLGYGSEGNPYDPDWKPKRIDNPPTGPDPVYDIKGVQPHLQQAKVDEIVEKGFMGVGPNNSEYFRNFYAMKASEAGGAAGSYEAKINAEIDTINQSFIPLEEERKDRTRRLQDRADLYNMFLGT